jgi:hypothetical protein
LLRKSVKQSRVAKIDESVEIWREILKDVSDEYEKKSSRCLK